MTKTTRHFSVSMAILFLTATVAPLLSGQSKSTDDKLLSKKFKRTQSDLNKGEKLLIKKQYDQAEEILLRVLKEMPENAQASFFLAETYYQKGDSEKGLAAIVEAEKNFPLIQKLLERQQREPISGGGGDAEDRALLENQINADQQITGEPPVRGIGYPVSPGAGQLNPKIGEKQASDVPGGQGVVSTVNRLPAFYLYLHGNLLVSAKRYEEAVAQYEKAIALDPARRMKLNYVAVVNLYYMAGQYDKALQYIERAEAEGTKIDPKVKDAVLKALGKQ